MSTNVVVKRVRLLGAGNYISEKDAAKLLGVCRNTMLNYRKQGKLKYYKFGTTVRYSIEEHIKPFLAGYEQRVRNRRPGGERLEEKRNGAPRRIAATTRV